MLVVRILPPRRAAEILGFIGAMFAFLCSQIGNLTNSFGRDINLLRDPDCRSPGPCQHALAAIELGGAGTGGTGRRSLAARDRAGGSHSRVDSLLSSGLPLSRPNACITPAGPGCRLSPAKRVRRSTRPVLPTTTSIGLARLLPKPVFAILQKDFLTLTARPAQPVAVDLADDLRRGLHAAPAPWRRGTTRRAEARLRIGS